MTLSIQLLSDLHLEFHRDRGAEVLRRVSRSDVDVLVVAGDIDNAHGIEESLKRICKVYKNSRVLWVAGNHEFYGSNFSDCRKLFERLQKEIENLEWLENRRIEINGQGFIGCTLWFAETYESKQFQQYLNDFYQIKDCDPYAFMAHDESVRYLKANIQEGDFVITHHMPSYNCVHPKYRNNLINCYFYTELKDLILDTKPAHWVCGHSHTSFDFQIGSTRMILNSLGYPTEQATYGFNPDLILDI